MSGIILSLSRIEKWTFPSESIRVQWIRWTPSERLSTPFIQHERNFSKSLTNRKWTFPSESIRVQWIRWTPSERLSTPSSNMSGIFLRIHLVGLYTNRLPVFRWKARGYDWILVDSIGQPSSGKGKTDRKRLTATAQWEFPSPKLQRGAPRSRRNKPRSCCLWVHWSEHSVSIFL